MAKAAELVPTKIERHLPLFQRALGYIANVFVRYPELFAISSEPFLNLVPTAIYIIDRSGDDVYFVNPALSGMLGYDNSEEFKEIIKQNGGFSSIYKDPKEKVEWSKKLTQKEKDDESPNVRRCQLILADGSTIYAREQVASIGKLLIGTLGDVSDQVKIQRELELSAKVDHLTGLPNRRGYEEQVEYEMKRASRQKEPLSVLMIDIDYFKRINDEYGHPFGDVILQIIANELKKNVRGIDIVSRWGGEEFFVTLPETDVKGAFIIAEKIRDVIAHLNIPIGDDMGTITNTVSIGIAQWSTDMTIKQLEEAVDTALYAAKENGRNQSVAYIEGMKRRKNENGNGHNGNGHVIQ